ncbi:MAG: TerC family protein [Phycisphaerales bacterium]
MMLELVEIGQSVVHALLATPPVDPEAAQAAIEGAQHAAAAAGEAAHGHGEAVQGINWSIAEVFTAAGLAALVTLVAMEIILGIDNIIFIAVLTEKLPPEQQPKARRTGILAAMVMRLILLFSITWIMTLTRELFAVMGHSVTGKDLVLLLGGAFLVYKATMEIHHKLEDDPEGEMHRKAPPGFAAAIFQIMLLDLVFSLDSVITAVGMAGGLIWTMVIAIVVSVAVMLVAAGPIANFVKRHPTTKMLALAFLLLIGVMLVADGMGHHVPKGYIYAAMAFSVLVEVLNLLASKAAKKRKGTKAAA